MSFSSTWMANHPKTSAAPSGPHPTGCGDPCTTPEALLAVERLSSLLSPSGQHLSPSLFKQHFIIFPGHSLASKHLTTAESSIVKSGTIF